MEKTTEKINIDKNKLKGFFCQLFKFDKTFFKDFIFYIHIVVQILVFASNLYTASQFWILYFVFAILFSPIVFLFIRFVFEFITILFSINDNLFEIKNNLKK